MRKIIFIFLFFLLLLPFVNSQEEKKPFLKIEKEVKPERISFSGKSANDKADVTINILGKGEPVFTKKPHDIVFVMDSSGSMAASDPDFKRVVATTKYVDTMFEPDRGAVVRFADYAVVVKDHHLNSNYSQIKEDLKDISYSAGTNFEAAIKTANQELIKYGDRNRKEKIWLEIFLTDGIPDPPECNVSIDTINEAKENNITIITVGLGIDADENLLRWIASETGGEYYYAKTAGELVRIYEEIALKFKNYTAASNIKVIEALPDYIELIDDSLSRRADSIERKADGVLIIQWNITKLMLEDGWSVSYSIKAEKYGRIAISVNNTVNKENYARVEYKCWNGTKVIKPMPDTYIYVFLPLLPPTFYVPQPPPPPPPPPQPPPLLPVHTPPTALMAPPPTTPVVVTTPVYTFAPFVSAGFIAAGFIRLGIQRGHQTIKALLKAGKGMGGLY